MLDFFSFLIFFFLVYIWSYSGPHFPAFGLNTEYLFSPNAGKCGPE